MDWNQPPKFDEEKAQDAIEFEGFKNPISNVIGIYNDSLMKVKNYLMLQKSVLELAFKILKY